MGVTFGTYHSKVDFNLDLKPGSESVVFQITNVNHATPIIVGVFVKNHVQKSAVNFVQNVAIVKHPRCP